MAKDYYANKHGLQLQDFLVKFSDRQFETNSYYFTMSQGFFTLNALKYKVRAGKKEGNSYEQDMQKVEDYILLNEKVGYPRYEVELMLEKLVLSFEEWEGGDLDVNKTLRF